MIDPTSTNGVWIIAGFFLLLAIGSISCSLYWHKEANRLNEDIKSLKDLIYQGMKHKLI